MNYHIMIHKKTMNVYFKEGLLAGYIIFKYLLKGVDYEVCANNVLVPSVCFQR